MYSRRVVVGAVLILFFSDLSLNGNSFTIKSRRLTVLGTLTDNMTVVGAESSGWTIQLNPVISVDGKLISSIQIKSSNNRQLESLEDKFVQAKGRLTLVSGIEIEQRPVFEVSSIKEHRGRKSFAP